MAFLERLRRQKEAAEQAVARQAETERLQMIAEQQREEIRLAEARRIKEEARRRETIRAQTLQASIVPKLLEDLADILGKRVSSYRTDSLYIDLKDEEELRFYNRYERKPHRILDYTDSTEGSDIEIQVFSGIFTCGLENGSVQVGSMVLSPADAKNHQRVDAAIEKAYKKPELLVSRYWTTPYQDGYYSNEDG